MTRSNAFRLLAGEELEAVAGGADLKPGKYYWDTNGNQQYDEDEKMVIVEAQLSEEGDYGGGEKDYSSYDFSLATYIPDDGLLGDEYAQTGIPALDSAINFIVGLIDEESAKAEENESRIANLFDPHDAEVGPSLYHFGDYPVTYWRMSNGDYFLDINGNGRPELLVRFGSDGNSVYLNRGEGFTLVFSAS